LDLLTRVRGEKWSNSKSELERRVRTKSCIANRREAGEI
jgi:hypothetical protein